MSSSSSLSPQIELLTSLVKQSLEDINAYKANTKPTMTAFISGVQTESIKLNGSAREVHRCFVSGSKFPLYNNVGWLLLQEIGYCLICSNSFGMFRYQYHCYGCGNIVCSECSPNEALVDALMDLGPLRVCKQCYWDQEVVNAMQNREVNVPKLNGFNLAKANPETSIRSSHETSNGDGSPRLFKSYSSNSDLSITPTVSVENQKTSFSAHDHAAGLERIREEDTAPRTPKDSRPSDYQNFMSVIPEPGFVLKTKQLDGKKVFVNICSHELLPKSNDSSNNQIYKIVGLDRISVDKEGEEASLFDVVISPGDLSAVQTDLSGKTRVKVCSETLVLLHQLFRIQLETTYTILKVAANYKYDDSGVIGNVFIPPANRFQRDPKQAAMDSLILCRLPPTELSKAPTRKVSNAPMMAHTASNNSNESALSPLSSNGQAISSDKSEIAFDSPEGIAARVAAVHPPPSKTGQLFKQGRFMKSWKRRLIGLENGLLSYYESTDVVDVKKMKGSLFLAGYTPSLATDGKIKLTGNDREMLMYDSNDRSDKTMKCHQQWLAAMLAHAEYANAIIKIDPMVAQRAGAVDVSDLRGTMVNNDNSLAKIPVFVEYVDVPTACVSPKLKPRIESDTPLKLSQLLITPSPGFAVELVKVNGQKLHLNVCHSDSIGLAEKLIRKQMKRSTSTSSTNAPVVDPSTIPHLGSVGCDQMTTVYTVLLPTLTLDVLITSEVFFQCASDPSPDRYDEVATEVLDYLASIGVAVQNSFSFPDVPGGYMYPRSIMGGTRKLQKSKLTNKEVIPPVAVPITGDLAPVLNLPLCLNTGVVPCDQVTVISGELFSQRQRSKDWKRRNVRLVGRRIEVYIQETELVRRVFDLYNCVMETLEMDIANNGTEMYPFRLISALTPEVELMLAATSNEERSAWLKLIGAQSRFIGAMALCCGCPGRRAGELSKCGRGVIHTWKKRYFVLELGMLKYYEKQSTKGDEGGVNLKGQLLLVRVKVERPTNSRINLIAPDVSDEKNLLIETHDPNLADLWFDELTKQADFASKNPVFVLCDEV